MNTQKLLPHLFRQEFSKIVAVLVKRFGVELIDDIEDIASETFLAALETWPYSGIPENPSGWLYAVAKNKTKNFLHRQNILNKKLPVLAEEMLPVIQTEIDLSMSNIRDSQLQMIFAVCHPALPKDSQVGMALRILCGFGIEEIANAQLTNKETVNKRLFRAKELMRKQRIEIAFPPEHEIQQRLDSVLTAIYLLFNEGYYSESHQEQLREELCEEAIRLTELLTSNEITNTANVNALLALMYFHSSRFPARKEKGQMILYDDQDDLLWNREMIEKGALHLKIASNGSHLSRYHLEAAIAYWHTVKDEQSEKWESILRLYDYLLALEYSPIVALNRTFAFSKVHGKAAALPQAEDLQLDTNPYYFTLLGELYRDSDISKAYLNYNLALSLVKSDTDRQTILRHLSSL